MAHEKFARMCFTHTIGYRLEHSGQRLARWPDVDLSDVPIGKFFTVTGSAQDPAPAILMHE